MAYRTVHRRAHRAAAPGAGWAGSRDRHTRRPTWTEPPPAVDVYVPVYDEPVAIVEPTVRAATRISRSQ